MRGHSRGFASFEDCAKRRANICASDPAAEKRQRSFEAGVVSGIALVAPFQRVKGAPARRARPCLIVPTRRLRALLHVSRQPPSRAGASRAAAPCVSYVESLCTDHWGCSPLGEARGLARRRPTEPTGALGGRRRGLGQGTLSREPTDTTSPSPSPNPSPRPNLIPGEGTLARERAYGRPPWLGPRPGRAAVHALDCRRDGRGP